MNLAALSNDSFDPFYIFSEGQEPQPPQDLHPAVTSVTHLHRLLYSLTDIPESEVFTNEHRTPIEAAVSIHILNRRHPRTVKDKVKVKWTMLHKTA